MCFSEINTSSEYVHLFPHSGPTKLGNEKQRTPFFSEYRTYDVSLYSYAYLRKTHIKRIKLNKQAMQMT